MDKQHIINTD